MYLVSTLLASALVLGRIANAAAGQLQSVNAFNAGPTRAKMYIYVPSKKLTPAPIVVAIHYCTGTGPGYFSGSRYATLADTKGFIVIYPSSPSSGGCWDVSSKTSLTHDAGGDSKTIVNMVDYAVKNYGGDRDRVFATGSSSGAMMTNVLAGAYPDVFKAGSVYSGVPDGCFYVSSATAGMATPGWNNECANGRSVKTAQQWGDLTRSYYPGYQGSYPKMLIWHGSSDYTLGYGNYQETLKQWSNIHDISLTSTKSNSPQGGYTQSTYGDGSQLIGYSGQGVGHTVPIHEEMDLEWFGIA